MKVIYLAGPYRAATTYAVKQNIRRAEDMAVRVWAAGAACICPHLNTAFLDGAVRDGVWLEGDQEILRRCDAVLTLHGWERSQGASAEVGLAAAIGLPVFHAFTDLAQWLLLRESSHARPAPC